MSVAEAALLLGCSSNHIYRLIESNEFLAVPLEIGRSLTRIRVAEIEAFLDSPTF
ncbi:helix-turn-helix domain-containing protein [Salinibacterium sp. SWN248]|uniref:helix-turn-helix domain-containing protein n=1 Tax=Salinibacterium sp. SWN248 TaxID=2792056 RepID=UPI0018CCC46C|nr:helix-turn-helix domain-containing protein [Salinibacterium sp. SWN248]